MEIRKGIVRLGLGHSLIIGHGPQLSNLDLIKDDDKKRLAEKIESFGLFNIATPDTKTYYKDVKAEDLNPKPEDYIKPIFRGLSEVVVRKEFDPIDFGHEKGVLKDSRKKLEGQSIFTNHEAAVGNEVGVVSNTFWDHGYELDGMHIPAGINFEAMIDGKMHPKLCREILSTPPIVHSNSVTVQFKWAQSHPKMEYNDFRAKVGTYDDKKQLIRRIVNGIDLYNETSFVSHGADPFAQKVDSNGKIVNPKYAIQRDSFSEGQPEGRRTAYYYFSDFKTSLSEKQTIPDDIIISENEDSNKTKNKTMKKELALLLAILAGVTLSAEVQAIPEAEFSEKFNLEDFQTQLIAKKTELEALPALKTELEQTKTKLTDLEKFKNDNEGKLKDLAQIDTLKASTLAEVLRISKIVNGKEPEATLKATYEAADLKTLQAFLTPLESQLEDKFPMSCKKCGSKELNRSTVQQEDKLDDKKPKSNDEVRAALKADHRAKTNKGFISMTETSNK